MSQGLRRASRPLFVWGVLCGLPLPLAAQDPVRPWLDWRTVTTRGFRFHYPAELETWTRHVASRVEAADSAIAGLVGWRVPTPMDVVVDDPFVIANGYALPLRDKPVTVWWATPADPRNDIGNYLTFGELLAVHELAHMAHLTRPSRNPLRRALWASLPADVGPITLSAPRWVFEGYATVIEGRITGTGRPYNAWRPAMLRQWAIEGRLPSYGQLANWNDFSGGEFAYLGGSAFLEWLMRREGDSSLVHLWRRMTAREVRSFGPAFRGVYGDTPDALYGLHTADLTRDAMAAKAALEQAGLVEGELVQRLSWSTGDPALSADGQRVAIVLRERDRPGRLVVWKSAPQPEDTAAIRRRIEALTRDPEDVPDRRFHPVPKVPEKTLLASQGRSYQMPRWFADNRRVLATRWTARSDGTLSPALYVWDTEADDVRQVTAAVGVLHGDPHPNGREAVAMQCHWGHCDIVHVDLARGVMRTILEGTPDRTYFRPRYSPDGSRLVASVADEGHWKLLVAQANGRAVRFVADDGANRYDAQWLDDSTLVAVSERGGIANLERIPLGNTAPVTLTRVTGAAVAPEVNRADNSIWFLSLHSRGLDVRRLPADTPVAGSVVPVDFERYGFAGTRGPTPRSLPENRVSAPQAYGVGPRHARWIPGGYASGDGFGGFVSVYSGDIVGRLTATATGAYGENGNWQGGSARALWRYPRPHLELGIHGVMHEPSLGTYPQPDAAALDGSLTQGVVAASAERAGEWWRMAGRVGGATGRLSPRDAAPLQRPIGFADLALRLQQQSGARGLAGELRVHGSTGRTGGTYHRALATLDLRTLGRDAPPLHLSVTAGRVVGAPHPFELFAVGGSVSPVMDSALLRQRHAMPMFPSAIATGRSLLAWRAAIPGVWTAFFEGASTADNLFRHRRWHRVLGLDTRAAFPAVPVAFLPRIELRAGAAYPLDEPFRKRVRGFFEMTVTP